jgi:hypothetical protein
LGMAADQTLLYLGCAALLIATVMLRPSPKIRAGLFAAIILAAIAGGHSGQVARVATEVVAAAD